MRHFRNLGSQDLHFPPEGVAVIGDNAQGKSNLLEAIYYLESFRSFRGAGDPDLTAFSEDVFHLRAEISGSKNGAADEARADDDPITLAVGFDRQRKKKKVSVDGSYTTHISAALGRLGAVIFSPADSELVSGGPGRRRRFLDIVLSLNQPGYLESLRTYRKVLAQRNSALRLGGPEDSIRAWDHLLIENGARVTRMRSDQVAAWSAPFAEFYKAISSGEHAALAYRADLSTRGGTGIGHKGGAQITGHDDSGEQAQKGNGNGDTAGGAEEGTEKAVRERFARRLDDSWRTDQRRGSTTVGPHRDDLLISVEAQGAKKNSVLARSFGSGGQRRTAALALRLAEAATIRERRGVEPILLLDDAFAELDEGRADRVVSLVESGATGQVILTAPRDSDVRLRRPSLPRWRISGGVIEA